MRKRISLALSFITISLTMTTLARAQKLMYVRHRLNVL
jgi:hypothetical protein